MFLFCLLSPLSEISYGNLYLFSAISDLEFQLPNNLLLIATGQNWVQMSTLKFRTIFHHLTFYFGWVSPSSCSVYSKLSKWYQPICCVLPIWIVRLLAKVVNLLMLKLRAKFTAYFLNPSNLLTPRIFTSLYMW